MIEILFGESESAALKIAKGNTPQRCSDGPTAVIGGEKTQSAGRAFRQAVPGTPDEVLCLAFQLDVGSIALPMESAEREETLVRLFGCAAYAEDMDGMEQAIRESAALYRRDLRRLRNAAAAGEPMRVWVSEAPYSRCGLCWLCRELEGSTAPLSVVELPAFDEQGDSAAELTAWAEVPPEKWSCFLPLERALSAGERRLYALKWNHLTAENAPLRAVVSGLLQSVPEDFYDALLLENVTGIPQTEARILGKTLGKHLIGVSDGWYAGRINALIAKGILTVTRDDASEYRRELQKKE